MKQRGSNENLKAIPLGGHGEIGKSCWIYEYKDEIVIVNFGMMLPPHDLTGVDLVIPNTKYLIENKDKIKCLILTSAHDDACGGVFYLLEKLNIPKILGSKLAIECVKKQLHKETKMPEVEFLNPREEYKVTNNLTVQAISNTSILPDTYGLYIKCEAGNVLYTSSFKIDQTPPDKTLFDYYSYAQAGEDGVDILISDSTNIEALGYSQAEKSITKRFDEIFRDAAARVFIFGYANSLHKYQIVFNLAQKHKKRVFICGEYLNNKIQAAIKTGFIKVDNNLFLEEKDLKSVDDKELVVIVSGKYGNFLSALIEIAKEEHPLIKLKSKDIVVISANPPPGTARLLAHTIDQLFVQKVQVIGGRGQGVHASGHAAQEEGKFILTVAKPRAFVPSQGEERHLVIYGNLAENISISPNDIHILKNGDILELREQVARVANKVPADSIYYNEAKRLDIDEVTMKERQALAIEGTITIALLIDEGRNIIAGPEILAEACSFAKGKDWRAFCLGTVDLVKEAIKQSVERKETDLINIKGVVRDTVNKAVLELIAKRPLINVSIQEIKKAVTLKN
ncbi:MAG: hypothetical protein A3B68_07395 [Candidatus Melainabacteria bacterium RIFCSPHIGHO2_02_FULL_34_12]|nr:MAG: hypothetical protein A3B68_07395 [Candidatus Melainabacteria bacterium RIFCSPHIGHO2_02_FULL_34_12]